MDFGELITAMVTPFDSSYRINLESAKKLMQHLIENGSDSILLSGTTGESPTLSDEEKIELFALGADFLKGRAKVIAGTGSNDTAHSIELSKQAEKTGVDCILVVTPYYNKPGQEGLAAHFKAIASAVSIPVIIYNVPSRTACNISSKTAVELSKIENIIGIKEASSDFRQVAEEIRDCRPGFLVYSGNDGDTLPMLSIGAHGVISVASHIVGKQIKQMLKSFKAGDIKEAASLHNWLLDIFYGIFITANPVPIKTALNLCGIDAGPVRMPLCSMNDSELSAFKKILEKYDLK